MQKLSAPVLAASLITSVGQVYAATICNEQSGTTNVRAGPSAKNFEKVGSLPNGVKVKEIERVINPDGYEYVKISAHVGVDADWESISLEGFVYHETIADDCSADVEIPEISAILSGDSINTLSGLSLVELSKRFISSYETTDYSSARAYATELQWSRWDRLPVSHREHYTLILGHLNGNLGDWTEAASYYHQTIDMREQPNEMGRSLPPNEEHLGIAQLELAKIYADGKTGVTDVERAKKFITLSASNRNSDAIALQGKIDRQEAEKSQQRQARTTTTRPSTNDIAKPTYSYELRCRDNRLFGSSPTASISLGQCNGYESECKMQLQQELEASNSYWSICGKTFGSNEFKPVGIYQK